MPNDAAAEKSGSAEHGDGTTVRCHHNKFASLCRSFSLRVVEEPSRRSSSRSTLRAILKSFS